MTNMDTVKSSDVSSMEKIRKRNCTPSNCLKGVSIVTALTTELARPQVDTLGIEFHQEDVIRARVGVPIQGAFRVACHPGIASVVHLRKDRQLSFAVLHRCTWKFNQKLREKPIRQTGNNNDNAKPLQMQKR